MSAAFQSLPDASSAPPQAPLAPLGIHFLLGILLAASLLVSLLPRPVSAQDAYALQVQRMYVAYYGRPGDPAGVDYWAGRLAEAGGNWIADLVDAFGASAEYLDRFGGSSPADLIDELYRQLFNRAAEPVGKGYYIDLLNGANDSGLNPDLRTSTLARIALDIANGASGPDLAIRDRKLQVADYFTASIAAAERPYGEADLALGASILAPVGDSAESLTEALAAVDGFADARPTTTRTVVSDLPEANTADLVLYGLVEERLNELGTALELPRHGVSNILVVNRLTEALVAIGTHLGSAGSAPLSHGAPTAGAEPGFLLGADSANLQIDAETTAVGMVQIAPIDWPRAAHPAGVPTAETIMVANAYPRLVEEINLEQRRDQPDLHRVDNPSLYTALFDVIDEVASAAISATRRPTLELAADGLWRLINPTHVPYGHGTLVDRFVYPFVIDGRAFRWRLDWPPVIATQPVQLVYPFTAGRLCVAKYTPDQGDFWRAISSSESPLGEAGTLLRLSPARFQDEMARLTDDERILRNAQLLGLSAYRLHLGLNALRTVPGLHLATSLGDLAGEYLDDWQAGDVVLDVAQALDGAAIGVDDAAALASRQLAYHGRWQEAYHERSWARWIATRALGDASDHNTKFIAILFRNASTFYGRIADAMVSAELLPAVALLADTIEAADHACYSFDTATESVETFDPLAQAQRDSDGDGVLDRDDQCPGQDDTLDADADGTPDCLDDLVDSDGDGVADDQDQCQGVDDRIDVDQDGTPDCVDLVIDTDGDGVADADDQCPGAHDGIDFDEDGIPDCIDPLVDSDGDEVADDQDQCPGQDDRVDVDEDGTPDCLDDLVDSDGDGVADDLDQCPGDNDRLDVDQDGTPDCNDPSIAYTINDTGIVRCANQGIDNLDCPAFAFPGQDADYGRDATQNDPSDGHAGFSFTKLDAAGNALPARASDWSCVRDNVTGLVWEVKTDDDGLRDKDWDYSWYNPDPAINGGSAGSVGRGSCGGGMDCDTYTYVAAVNAQGLCGARDWRLPTVDELRSIVSYDRRGPAIDTDYFPKTQSSSYWSSSPYADYSGLAWYVDFDSGYVGSDYKYYARHVRLVGAGQ